MTTLKKMTDTIRRHAAAQAERYHVRITWIDGKPHIQCCPVSVSLGGGLTRWGNYVADGVIVREATPEDLQAMYAGWISFDPQTEPSQLAWAKHVAEGGD